MRTQSIVPPLSSIYDQGRAYDTHNILFDTHHSKSNSWNADTYNHSQIRIEISDNMHPHNDVPLPV